jgi:glycosyltransferase involved in cell wall biosynthesis
LKISFLICTHNEGDGYLGPLFNAIGEFCKKTSNELVILDDISTDDSTIKKINEAHEKYNAKVVYNSLFDGQEHHFGRHKTFGSRACSGEWIFLIDGDEYPHPTLLDNIEEILDLNKDVDLIKVPRLNYIEGMTNADVLKWGWRVQEIEGKRYINPPDYQHRLYKNSQVIYWTGRLHETIEGAAVISDLPFDPHLCLVHNKTIRKQTEQNVFYNSNFTRHENMGHKK